MVKILPKLITVTQAVTLTPNMKRITLGGEHLAAFPSGVESAHVKLTFPLGKEKMVQPSAWEALFAKKSISTRPYTVRNFDAASGELEIDFVLHEHGGPAGNWAARAEPGDTIAYAGPGPTKLVDGAADWFLLAGDMTALPAIAANLEQLPKDATGHALIEITCEADKQEIIAPKGIEISWLINPEPGRNQHILVDAVREIPWRSGVPAVWVACEFTAMKSLRGYFKDERNVGKNQLYASSYWKYGATEEEHKRVKNLDMAS